MYVGAPEPTSSLLGHDIKVVQKHVRPAQFNGVDPERRRVPNQAATVLDPEHEAKGFVSQKVLEGALTCSLNECPSSSWKALAKSRRGAASVGEATVRRWPDASNDQRGDVGMMMPPSVWRARSTSVIRKGALWSRFLPCLGGRSG